MNYCAQCGNELKPNARFCGNCGTTIIQEFQNTGNLAVPPPVPPPIVKPPYPAQAILAGQGQPIDMPNSQRRIVRLWLVLLAVFLFLIFLPSIIGLDGFDGGFAMSFAAGFMGIISIIIIFIYRSRANQLDRILSGKETLADWRYSSEEWLRFATKDFEEDKKLKRTLFFLVAGISVVIGIVLTLIYQDLIFIPIILALIVIVAIPAIWAPRYRYNKLKQSDTRVVISQNGLIVGKIFHLWVKLGAKLDRLEMDQENDPPILSFTYSMPTRTGRQEEVARVPVPAGKMDEASALVYHFTGQAI